MAAFLISINISVINCKKLITLWLSWFENGVKNYYIHKFAAESEKVAIKIVKMPYRRLPNTDQARLRAIQTAVLMGQKKTPDQLAFSAGVLNRVHAFFPNFETTLIHHNLARSQQDKNSSTYLDTVRKARIYLSHFVQILNFSIQRGDLRTEVRSFYGMVGNKKSPSLLLESDLLEWGKKIIEGEHQRILHGGNPIYNPSIAVVKVKFDQFLDAFHHQKTLQNNTARWTQKVASLRGVADEIILDMWNEVEEFFSNLTEERKREKASEYGVVYVYRPMERLSHAEKQELKKERNKERKMERLVELKTEYKEEETNEEYAVADVEYLPKRHAELSNVQINNQQDSDEFIDFHEELLMDYPADQGIVTSNNYTTPAAEAQNLEVNISGYGDSDKLGSDQQTDTVAESNEVQKRGFWF